MHKYISYYILMFLKEHTIMFFSKIVMSTRHVYTYKCGSEPATYRLKWQYPVINEPKCCFLFVCCCCFLLLLFFVFCFFLFFFSFLLFFSVVVFFLLFCCCCFFGGGEGVGSWIIFYFNFSANYVFLLDCLHSLKSASNLVTKRVWIIDTHTLPRWGCSSLFPYTAITEIRDAATVALSCCTRSPMTLSQSQPPIISHQTVGSPDTSTLAYRQIPTLKNYDKYTFFPRTIIHWNALPAFIPLLPILAQFSNAVCQVVHFFP